MGNSVKDVTIDWARSIHIDSAIDEEVVRRLSSRILLLRQESQLPITVGIDSPGGSLAALDVLIGLLTGPSQDGRSGSIITVATHRAYSAAASLLALGNYAVGLEHAQIIFHDVRMGGIDDVTPEKARDAAKTLQDANDRFAIRLAHRVIGRLGWIYLDRKPHFDSVTQAFPQVHGRYSAILNAHPPYAEVDTNVDLAGFTTFLWARLSSQSDSLVDNVMDRFRRWIAFTRIANSVPSYREKGSRIPGLLDGAKHLNKLLSGSSELFRSREDDLKRLISLLVADISNNKVEGADFRILAERSVREFGILESMLDPGHLKVADSLVKESKHLFLKNDEYGDFDKMPEDKQAAILANALPHAQLFWLFSVLLCRELLEGEHILRPEDAQLLGLIDEVAGGGAIQSRREFREEQAKNAGPGNKKST